MREAKYHIIQAVDYLNVKCAKDGQTCQINYRGLDPLIPLIEIVCPKCGSGGVLKLGGKGAEGWHRLSTQKPRRQTAARNRKIKTQLESPGISERIT